MVSLRETPEKLEHIQLKDHTALSIKNVLEFIGQKIEEDEFDDYRWDAEMRGGLRIHTNIGVQSVMFGEWIVKDSKGEFSICSQHWFDE